jgi:GntR family transcriptional regulator
MKKSPVRKPLSRVRPRVRSAIVEIDADALYERCAQQLRNELQTGALPTGKRLPSERAVAQATGFTRLTVRRALFSLEEEGFLERAPRRGWRVRAAPLSEPPNTLMGFTAMAAARGLVASAKVLKHLIRPANVEEAEQLRIAPGAGITEVSRLRMLDGQPTAVEELRIPTSRIRWPEGFNFTQSVHAAFEAQGVIPTRADAIVDVIEAGREDARLLGVSMGKGLLRLNSVTYGADGIPVSLDVIRYHPDRYRFRATLERHATLR